MRNFILFVFIFLITSTPYNLRGAMPSMYSSGEIRELIPEPVSRKFTEGEFRLNGNTEIISGESLGEFQVRTYLEDYVQMNLSSARWHYTNSGIENNSIELNIDADSNIPKEGYRLEVRPDVIKITASDKGGLFYGVVTLLQLMPPTVYRRIPVSYADHHYLIGCQTIEDYPHFEYRGMMLDVARSFSDKQTVLNFIDRIAHHKLNRFHWHLTDDEGWRIEIKSYPELATIGGFRGGDSPVMPIYGEWEHKYGGYFTQDDIREIVDYAAIRNIEIIPEIELPGHSRAVAKVYPQILCEVHNNKPTSDSDRRNVWCVAKEPNYQMLDSILREVCELFPSKYIHIGGDEVQLGQWRGCADCKKIMRQKGYSNPKQLTDYFVSKVSAILRKYGREAMVWDEAAESGVLDKRSQVSGWQGLKESMAATQKGYKTVVTAGEYLYFDMKQAPQEDGLTWAGLVNIEKAYSLDLEKAGFTTAQLSNVLGVEATFFSELLVSHRPEYLDYQTYPRICALSEVAWRKASERDWDGFYERLTSDHLERLEAMGIKYRLFPPTIKYHGGVISASAPFDGVEIRYTDDGTAPNADSKLYEEPIDSRNPERYRFCAFFGPTQSHVVVPIAQYSHKIGALETKIFDVPLEKITNGEGMWYFHIRTSQSNMRLERVVVVSDQKTTTIIGYPQNINQMHRMRLYANAENKNGVMQFTIRNNNDSECDLSFNFERPPYIEPKVKVTSSMGENGRFPFSNVEDYNFTSYSRTNRTCKKGEHITFTFRHPVDAQSIEVATGLTYLPRYHIISGSVQVSTDGDTFNDVGRLVAGKITVQGAGEIKAIRIISDMDGNSENAVAIQDLKITPKNDLEE